VDVFLYFFEAKSPGKKLWMSFNGVAGKVLLTLFQQSYKGFKGKFFKICCSKHDLTLLDGFPLYWVEKAGLKKPRSLEDLAQPDREVCQHLSSLGVVFNTAELIKLEYSPKHLKGYIGIFFDFVLSCLLAYIFVLLLDPADNLSVEELPCRLLDPPLATVLSVRTLLEPPPWELRTQPANTQTAPLAAVCTPTLKLDPRITRK